jgi:hypothetical protein
MTTASRVFRRLYRHCSGFRRPNLCIFNLISTTPIQFHQAASPCSSAAIVRGQRLLLRLLLLLLLLLRLLLLRHRVYPFPPCVPRLQVLHRSGHSLRR